MRAAEFCVMPQRRNQSGGVVASQRAKAEGKRLVPAVGEHNKSLEMTADGVVLMRETPCSSGLAAASQFQRYALAYGES